VGRGEAYLPFLDSMGSPHVAACAPVADSAGENPPEASDRGNGDSLGLEANVERLERRLIERALAQAGGNRTRAAKLLDISRNGLAIKIERLGLRS